MKIAKVVIENFRHIKRKELDFTDSLGRVRDMTLIVGPNASGKTTLLDALAVGPGWLTELSFSRPDLIWSPARMVRHGTLNAQITYYVRFSPDEIDTTRELFKIAEKPGKIPDVHEATITWRYPDPRKQHRKGHFAPSRNTWNLFKGRLTVAKLLSTGLVDWEWFKKVGGVFTFDQQRTGMGKTIPRDIWEIIQRGHSDIDSASHYTTDPREILLSLAIKSSVARNEKTVDQFELIKARYAEICTPHQIKGIREDEIGELDIIFDSGTYEYGYDGLSSGEQMFLLFLIRMVTEHIHQSIVLIDEIELHQHPIWQSKLFYLLPHIGLNNQFIVTTHSAYLRDVVSPEAVIELDDLGDQESEEE